MKKLQTLLLALCAAIFAACSSDSIVDEPTPTPQPEPQGITTIHATIEPMTRTAIGEEAADHSAKITWKQGDRILAFGEGGTGKAIYEIANADDAATGKFTLVSGQTSLTAITAANYPATGETKGDFNLSVQVYNPAADAFPAYMTADAPAANQLTFRHAVAYICVNLKADRLNEILLRGTGIVTGDADEDEWITLLCNQTEPFTTTSRQFFIAMQPKETIDLNIIVNKGENAAKKVVAAKTFEKKHVYRATADYPAADIPTGWQPLRNRFGQTSFEGIVINGLAWAPVNCGYAIDPTHLDWGEQDKRRGKFYANGVTTDIPSGWRKPTKAECEALLSTLSTADPNALKIAETYAHPVGWYLNGTSSPGNSGVFFDAPGSGHPGWDSETTPQIDTRGQFWIYESNTAFNLDATAHKFWFNGSHDGNWRFAIRAVKTAESEGGNEPDPNTPTLDLVDNHDGTGTLNGHAWVDLGLTVTVDGVPKRLVFADRNIGAENPEDKGMYFWWGDIVGHAFDSEGNTVDNFSFEESTCGSWNNNANYIGADNNLKPEKDAATQLWGEGWRMGTSDDFNKLLTASRTAATVNSVSGYEYSSSAFSGKTIFIPRGGVGGKQHNDLPNDMYYWTSTNSGYSNCAVRFEGSQLATYNWRWNGYPIRPVAVLPAE